MQLAGDDVVEGAGGVADREGASLAAQYGAREVKTDRATDVLTME